MGFRDMDMCMHMHMHMCPRPARSWCEGSSIRPPQPSPQPDTEERQELGLRLRLRLREGPGSRESRCAALSCSLRVSRFFPRSARVLRPVFIMRAVARTGEQQEVLCCLLSRTARSRAADCAPARPPPPGVLACSFHCSVPTKSPPRCVRRRRPPRRGNGNL